MRNAENAKNYKNIEQDRKDREAASTNKTKGLLNGICARSICFNEPANFYNKSTRRYYCASCAKQINACNRRDALELYGTEL